MTPVDVAAGYTTFANIGMRAEPQSFATSSRRWRDPGKVTPQTHTALDPRVAYLVTSVLKDVLNHGTAREYELTGSLCRLAGRPARMPEKTAGSPGFTSNLVCVIWIGFDDNRDFGLSGGSTAAPIWADFMNHAPRCRAIVM